MRYFAFRSLSIALLAVSAQALSDDLPAGSVAAAAAAADMTGVRALVRGGADVNALGTDGSTALAYVVRYRDAEVAKLLLRAGARPDQPTRLGVLPLHVAIENADLASVQVLLDAGADANSADATGEPGLLKAARVSDTRILETLLRHGADPAKGDTGYGQTALMVAAREGNVAAVKLLLAKGAAVDAQTRAGKVPAFRLPSTNSGSKGAGIVRGGWPARGERDPVPGAKTALLYATREGHVEVTRLLLDAGAALEKADANDVTPLLMALINGQLAVGDLLLERGANVNASDWYGQTPLFAAVDWRNLEIPGPDTDNGVDRAACLEMIRKLLARGADVNARTREYPPQRRWVTRLGSLSWVDFTGQTAFVRAALSGDVAVMRLLLAHGADASIATDGGTTALMAAAGVNWTVAQTFDEGPEALLEAVKLCVEQGNDVNAVNAMGLQAVHGAANRGSNDIVRFLASRGAQLDRPDREGRTPEVWAAGVFLATHPPVAKPETVALLRQLQAKAGRQVTTGAVPDRD